MIIWVIIIFLLGLILSFTPEGNLPLEAVRLIGIAITLISVGIAARSSYLARKGEKERLSRRVEQLEKTKKKEVKL